ncbi:hypothetical protein AML35_24150 [Escherichia coli]|nr:hypothetical protein AML35_24150 [Escherichia coli]OEN37339.1 hypothetical protein BHF46_03445 [Escherichia coli]
MPDALRLSSLRDSCNILILHVFAGRIRRSRRIRQEAIRKGRRSSPPFLFLQSAIIIPQFYTFWVNT